MQKDIESLRVLLIGSERSLRSTIRDALISARDVDVASETATVDQASELIHTVAPDVIVLHVGEDDTGPEHVQHIRTVYPRAHVIAVSPITDPEYAERVLRAGALGFLAQSSAAQEIPEAVRSVSRDRAYVNRRVARKVLAHLIRSGSSNPHDHLTPREREVFDLIGTRDTREIAEGLGLSVRTVRGYIRSIRSKLSLPTSSELVEYARQWQSEQA